VNINIFLLVAFITLAARAQPLDPGPPVAQPAVPTESPANPPQRSPSPSATQSLSAIPTSSPVQVSGEPNPDQSSKFDSGLLGGSNPVLSEQERAGVAITRAWKDKSYQTLVSQPGANSSVQFRFGESLPSIVCAILQVTDIELQAGEIVTHINLGDSTRWTVESALSGSGSEQVQHLIVKPRDIGLSTSLVVTTDRRTYHLLLISDETEFMHDVTFLYDGTPSPTAPPAVANATPAPSPVAADPPARHSAGDSKQVSREPADDADESYTVHGKADWKPVQVYSKNGKTYLEMPGSVRHKEAPVLFEERKAGWFHHEKILVNYRVHGKWYVVDRVLDKATLVGGVGSGQEKVDIRHIDNATIKTEGGPR
jgi:type IV secretion system protein TrbG